MKGRQVRGEDDTVTIVAAEAITAFCLVNTLGCHEADDEAVGVALYDADDESDISVGVAPIEVVLSGGGCTAGGGLETDADGKVIDWASSGVIVGYALDTATGSDEYIRILLTHGGNSA